MRGKHHEPASAVQLAGMSGQGVERVGIDDHGHLGAFEQAEKEFDGFWLLPIPGPMAITDFFSRMGSSWAAFEIAAGDFAVISFQQGHCHQLWSHRGDGGQNGFSDGGGDQASPGAQRGNGAHRRSARLAPGSADHQDMPEAALVGIRGAKAVCDRFRGSRPGEAGGDSTASAGEPMGATTIGPRVSIPETWASLGAVNVTTASAR